MSPALIHPDHPLLIEAQVQRIGRNLAFSRAEFTDMKTNKLVCTGSHVKSFVDKKYHFV